MSITLSIIYMLLLKNQTQVKCFITGFYGRLKTGDKHLSWDLMRRINEHNSIPWCIIEDFNEIIYQNEKDGGRLQPVQ